jgi:conjugal transfer pilus assembly protein TraV
MSGYDAKSDFACKAPEGILCESMTGIYANAQAHNLPGQRVSRRTPAEDPNDDIPEELSHAKTVMTKPLYSGSPIRSAPRILRVWFAPWEDSDGDLHDQSYVYLPVDSGQWLIEHNRRRIQDTFRPVSAPTSAPAPETSTDQRRSSSATAQQNPFDPVPANVNQLRIGREQAEAWMNGVVEPGDVAPLAQ